MISSSYRITLVLILLLASISYVSLQIDTSVTVAQQWLIIQGQIGQDFDQIDWAFSRLPRAIMALMVGAVMGLIGSVIQQLTQNPLLSPVTLGSSSGAWLGLLFLAILWPEGQAHYQTMAAMTGSILALALVILIVGIRNLTGLSIVLAGMAVNLLFGAIATALILLNNQYAQNLFVWGAGDLSQNGWEKVNWLWPYCLPAIGVLIFASKPLTLLKLGQSAASARGLNVALVFLILMLVSIFMLSASITMVGIISFLGLVSPNLARLIGARTAKRELFYSSLIGAIILITADTIALFVTSISFDVIPTGLTTAFIGAIALIWLIRKNLTQQESSSLKLFHGKQFRFTYLFFILSFLFLMVLLGLLTHIESDNLLFHWPNSTSWPLRWPRILVSLFAGAAMAVSGVIMQRLIHNPLASPDLLGLSAGAVLSLVTCSLLLGVRLGQLGPVIAFIGSMVVLLILLLLGRRFRFAPTPMILTGVALSAFIETIIQFVLIRGTDEVYDILRWLAGSTYRVTGEQSIILAITTSLLILLSLSLRRWLTLLSLGDITALARGVPQRKAFIILLMLAAALCALVTSIVGPIAFVSIIAPHIASLLGARSSSLQLIVSALLGAALMQTADWLGQIVIYPNQLAAGTMISIIGGSYFIMLLVRNRKHIGS